MYCIIKRNRIMKRFNNLEKAREYAEIHSARIKLVENILIIRIMQKVIAMMLFVLALVSPRILFGEGSFLLIMVPVCGYLFFTKDLWLMEIFRREE